MNKAEILAFMNETHHCYLATVEGNRPRVRAMALFRADEDGIIIQTNNYKDVYKQISANPNVELCFHNDKRGMQVRVSGTFELLDDLEKKKEAVAERPILKKAVEKAGYEAIVLYILKKGVAYAWTPATNFDPKNYIQL